MEPNTTPLADDKSGNFEDRHKEELGVKRFAMVSGLNFIIPLAAAGIAGAAGYFALGRPIKALFPKVVRISDVGMELSSIYSTTKSKGLNKILTQLGEEFSEAIEGTNLGKMANALKADAKESAAAAGEALGTASDAIEMDVKDSISPSMSTREEISLIATRIKDPEKLKKFYEIIGAKHEDTSKYWGLGIGATVGSLLGSTVVNYSEWKKDESARLAAQEVNSDISKIELFKPSDVELVAENKRLRAMIAEKEALPLPANDHAGREHTQPDHAKHLAPHGHMTTLHAANDDLPKVANDDAPDTKVLHAHREPHGKVHEHTNDLQLG